MQANKRYFKVYLRNETWRKGSVYCFCTSLRADDAFFYYPATADFFKTYYSRLY